MGKRGGGSMKIEVYLWPVRAFLPSLREREGKLREEASSSMERVLKDRARALTIRRRRRGAYLV